MNEKGKHPVNFELIQGGLHQATTLGQVRIVAAPEGARPFKVQAMVFEEDTWLVMSASPTVCEPDIHPIRLMTDVINAEPEPVGSVVIRKGYPLRFLAIVHDVNQEPTWKEEWVVTALEQVFRECEKHKISAMGLPLLGTKHGRLEKLRFVALLAEVLNQFVFDHLKKLWLIVPPKNGRDIIKELEAEIAGI